MNTRNIGNKTEDLVVSYLIKNNYSIVERNFFNRYGEIDIIALKNNTLSFIEVKKMSKLWELSDITKKINIKKQRRIKCVASAFLAQKSNLKYDEISFDVVTVTDNDISYYKGAF